MAKLGKLLYLIVALPLVHGCTTSNSASLKDGLAVERSIPGLAVSNCAAPKIKTQSGICQEPKKLSWL
jgi:hypothetical protein